MYIELKNINKSYGDYKASNNINFSIEKGKLVALLGPSGSGKTTILRMIAGLEHPDSGEILINGQVVNDIEPSKRGIGFVFQSYALFKYMTIFDNIAFGLRVQKRDKAEIKERVLELIKLVGLEGLENRYPNQLSGGQRQRVAFARALAPNPKVLLLDEPFAAIDAKVRQELRSWLKDTIQKVGITSIFVTHDQDEAIEVADEIIVTNHGEIEQKGTPIELYNKPLTPFVAQFIGEATPITDYSRLKGFERVYDADNAVIRPQFISIYKDGEYNQFSCASEEGIVERVSFRGRNIEVKVNINGIILTGTRSVEEPQVEVGERVSVLIYRLYVVDDKKAYMIENNDLQDPNPVFI